MATVMPASATISNKAYAKFGNGPHLLGGTLTLSNGVANVRTPFAKVLFATANVQQAIGCSTEAPRVYPFTDNEGKWVQFTCGDGDDTIHFEIWGRE